MRAVVAALLFALLLMSSAEADTTRALTPEHHAIAGPLMLDGDALRVDRTARGVRVVGISAGGQEIIDQPLELPAASDIRIEVQQFDAAAAGVVLKVYVLQPPDPDFWPLPFLHRFVGTPGALTPTSLTDEDDYLVPTQSAFVQTVDRRLRLGALDLGSADVNSRVVSAGPYVGVDSGFEVNVVDVRTGAGEVEPLPEGRPPASATGPIAEWQLTSGGRVVSVGPTGALYVSGRTRPQLRPLGATTVGPIAVGGGTVVYERREPAGGRSVWAADISRGGPGRRVGFPADIVTGLAIDADQTVTWRTPDCLYRTALHGRADTDPPVGRCARAVARVDKLTHIHGRTLRATLRCPMAPQGEGCSGALSGPGLVPRRFHLPAGSHRSVRVRSRFPVCGVDYAVSLRTTDPAGHTAATVGDGFEPVKPQRETRRGQPVC